MTPLRRALLMSLVYFSYAFIAAAGYAETSEQVPVGVRAIGMGGAYSSLADDAAATFWNPAGLVWVGHQELMFTQADLFGAGIHDHLAAFSLPVSPNSALGMDFYHSGYEDSELNFGESRIDLSLALRPRPWLSVGGTAKYLTQSSDIDGNSLARGSGRGIDAGLIASPVEGLRLGLLARDMLDTRLRQDTGGKSEVLYPGSLRVAGSYAWRHHATVALDIDHRWHAGLEWTPLEEAALRFGIDDDRHDPDGATFSYGVGLRKSILRVDYALVDHPMLSATHHLSIALNVNLNPSQIKIEKLQSRDVYASLYRTYAHDTLATVQIRNLNNRLIETDVSMFLPGLMAAPTIQRKVSLRPGVVTEVALRPVLSWPLLERSGDHPAQLNVSATYQGRRLPRTEKSSARLTSYGPGAIDWSAGVAQAAAYVTARDSVVGGLARSALRAIAPEDIARFGSRNLAFAAVLFDCLGQLRITYVPDPNNPFSAVSEAPKTVDTVQYPGETLHKRTGDCDDTSVLMAALLASVGINTQFVDAPGHLFILVDSGIDARNRIGLSLDSTRTVVVDDEVWIPLETTAIKHGFAEAWRLGAQSYASWDERGQLELADVAASQATYEPADVAPMGVIPEVDASDLSTRIASDATQVAQWGDDFRDVAFPGWRDMLAISPVGLDRTASVLFAAGQFEAAQSQLESAVRMASGNTLFRNHLGVAMAARGLRDSALAQFDLGLRINNSDPSLWLNRGVLLYDAGDSAAAVQSMATGLACAGGADEVTRWMAQVAGAVRQDETQRPAAHRIHDLLSAARQLVAAGAVGKDGSRPGARALGIRSLPGNTITGGRMALKTALYWKE